MADADNVHNVNLTESDKTRQVQASGSDGGRQFGLMAQEQPQQTGVSEAHNDMACDHVGTRKIHDIPVVSTDAVCPLHSIGDGARELGNDDIKQQDAVHSGDAVVRDDVQQAQTPVADMEQPSEQTLGAQQGQTSPLAAGCDAPCERGGTQGVLDSPMNCAELVRLMDQTRSDMREVQAAIRAIQPNEARMGLLIGTVHNGAEAMKAMANLEKELGEKCKKLQEDLDAAWQRELDLKVQLQQQHQRGADLEAKLQQLGTEIEAGREACRKFEKAGGEALCRAEAAEKQRDELVGIQQEVQELREERELCLGIGDDAVAATRLQAVRELSGAKPVLFLRLLEASHRLTDAKRSYGDNGVESAKEVLMGVDFLATRVVPEGDIAAWREKAQPMLQEWSQGLCRLEWPKVGTAYDSKFHARQKGSDADETIIKVVNRGYIVDMSGQVLSPASVRT